MAFSFFRSLFFTFLLTIEIQEQSSDRNEQEGDRVKYLPEQPIVNFNHYAGYVSLKPDKDKALFYWFFEAENDPSQKPLVLWLTGGPGCSSVSFGATQEIGPFLVDQEKHLKLNEFSWNKVANIIFLESPIGVGFSYTNNTKDLDELGDQVVASDNYDFLLGWFRRFPNFRTNEFYIVAESYGGHYAPQLADLIHEGNKKGPYINLKGFMMGNAVINDITDFKGIYDFALGHTIISKEVYDGITGDCDLTKERQTNDCIMNLARFLKAYSDIDMFNIYSPICFRDNNKTVPKKPIVTRHDLTQDVHWNILPLSGYDFCPDDHVIEYFNRKDVQRAIHANVTNLSYPYTLCSTVIEKWNDSPTTMLPLIKKLLGIGLRIWMYSGDTDGRVPVLSTRYSLEEMKLNVTEGWRAWFSGGQVGGWVEEYDGGLTFASIRGAGHQAPAHKPQQALFLFSHFLSSRPLPSSRF
ncbi:serine carboxypeptidase-like 35 [Vigna unguiculata]|uniref:serine carboxypeptidase-like 35 n=1 Tax=Vigna unguiculata TaxID=3917 RepID=UPI001016D922|nr:serine carboxypeptidase-like 35 [Vigna unguiculata]XP_027909082.1 serine carboxypeptidase-like 35 [Vigna unguiculata]